MIFGREKSEIKAIKSPFSTGCFSNGLCLYRYVNIHVSYIVMFSF